MILETTLTKPKPRSKVLAKRTATNCREAIVVLSPSADTFPIGSNEPEKLYFSDTKQHNYFNDRKHVFESTSTLSNRRYAWRIHRIWSLLVHYLSFDDLAIVQLHTLNANSGRVWVKWDVRGNNRRQEYDKFTEWHKDAGWWVKIQQHCAPLTLMKT